MTVQRIELRRDTAANWAAVNPILGVGEEGIESDTLRRKIGDGSSTWKGLPYATALPSDVTAAQSAAISAAATDASSKANAAQSAAVTAAASDATAKANAAQAAAIAATSGQVTDVAMAGALGAQTAAAMAARAELKAAFVPALPSTGSYTYNGDGTIATDPDGNSYTWNADGTPKTQTKGGVTRTYTWNPDGTLASVS